MQMSGCADFSHPFIWSCVCAMWQFSIKVQRKQWQWLGKCSEKKVWAIHRHLNSSFSSRPIRYPLVMNTGGLISSTIPDIVRINVKLSWHCWWLWDILMDSDCWIEYLLCYHQICAKDPDSWLEVSIYWHFQGASPGHCQQCNLLVQDYHRWWELVLQLQSWDKAPILQMEMSNLNKTKKSETGEEHVHQSL